MFVSRSTFGVWDYVVFAAMLLVSMVIGIWFALRGGGQKTQGEYLMANRSMSIIPVAISILVSFMSAILILGNPAEMYTQGTEFYITLIGMIIGITGASLLFVPLLFPLRLTSVFEYLEVRFNSRNARLVGTSLMILTQVIYMGIASFAPATAFEAVTAIPVWATILTTGAVATLYTTIGGMKAVIWTDVFQSAIMLAGILAIVIQGTMKVGSLSQVWDINVQWNRIKFFNFDPDPRIRHTFWNMVIGSSLAWVGTYGISQASVQRYSSLPTLRNAKISILLNMIGVFTLVSLTCVAGLVLFAYYAGQNCDPLGQKLVNNPNQLVPYFVMETLGYPGVPGLFIACLFSGALSSISSSLNALGAITWEDILKPRYDKRLTEHQKTLVTKITVCIYGVLAIGVSFLAEMLEGTVLQAAASLIGAASGPLTGMFILGAFFPWANSNGVITGALSGLGLSFWLAIGSYVHGIRLPGKPFPNGTCPAYLNDTGYMSTTLTTLGYTATTVATSTAGVTQLMLNTQRTGLDGFYAISYQWFTAIGVSTVVVVGLVVSFITGANNLNDVPTKYMIPVVSRLCCCLPRNCQFWLNCRREFKNPEDIRSEENDTEIVVESPKLNDATINGFVNKAFSVEDEKSLPSIILQDLKSKEAMQNNSDYCLNGQVIVGSDADEHRTEFVAHETEYQPLDEPRPEAKDTQHLTGDDFINERF
ncbi:Sodium-coupled monocarboxylate transporter 1 [Bulinus truncatus]|nr:Sodium-coupled monocarboxylate transporter 1 [Bulinus truncatus]